MSRVYSCYYGNEIMRTRFAKNVTLKVDKVFYSILSWKQEYVIYVSKLILQNQFGGFYFK